MIQYQNVFDAFMRCDTNKLAEEFAALYDESKKDAEKRLEAVQKMIHASYERMKNTTLASNEDESMVVVCKSFDDAGDDVAFMLGDEFHDLSVFLATVHYIAHEDDGIGIYITA